MDGDRRGVYAESRQRGNEVSMEHETVSCPFCKDDGFDLIGLKAHFSYCELYDRIPNPIDPPFFQIPLNSTPKDTPDGK